MRVVSVPGRTVRHPVTHRIIGEDGVLVDPHDVTFIRLIADGDLNIVSDNAEQAAPALTAPVKAGSKE